MERFQRKHYIKYTYAKIVVSLALKISNGPQYANKTKQFEGIEIMACTSRDL